MNHPIRSICACGCRADRVSCPSRKEDPQTLWLDEWGARNNLLVVVNFGTPYGRLTSVSSSTAPSWWNPSKLQCTAPGKFLVGTEVTVSSPRTSSDLLRFSILENSTRHFATRLLPIYASKCRDPGTHPMGPFRTTAWHQRGRLHGLDATLVVPKQTRPTTTQRLSRNNQP